MRLAILLLALLTLNGCAVALIGLAANAMGAKPAYGVGTENMQVTPVR